MTYTDTPGTVVDLHSHPDYPAVFSTTDDEDETGFRLYAVVGPLNNQAQTALSIRIGIYGHRHLVDWRRVFDRPETSGLLQQPTRYRDDRPAQRRRPLAR